MRMYYITFRSVTHAQKAERLLKQKDISCTVRRTPRWMEAQGCGYALGIWVKEPSRAVQLLRENELPLRRIYLQRQGGELEELSL